MQSGVYFKEMDIRLASLDSDSENRVVDFVAKWRHSFLPRDAMLSAVYAVVYAVVVCLSVSVRHSPVLYQNG